MIAVILDRAGLDPLPHRGRPQRDRVGSRARDGRPLRGGGRRERRDVPAPRPRSRGHHQRGRGAPRLLPGRREEVEAAFAVFAQIARHVVACGDEDAGVAEPWPARRCRSCGTGSARRTTLWSAPLTGTAEGARRGDDRIRACRDRPRRPGRINLLNAAAAVGVPTIVGVPLAEAARAVGAFTGVRRRFERKGEHRGAVFVDDYAHHPTEVAAIAGGRQGAGTPAGRRVPAPPV